MSGEDIDMSPLKSKDFCQLCHHNSSYPNPNSSLLVEYCQCSGVLYHPQCLVYGFENGLNRMCRKCRESIHPEVEKRHPWELLLVPHLCWTSKKGYPFLYPLIIPPLVIAIVTASLMSQVWIWRKMLVDVDNYYPPHNYLKYGMCVLITWITFSIEMAIAVMFSRWFLQSFTTWVDENKRLYVRDRKTKQRIPRVYYPSKVDLKHRLKKLFYPPTYEGYLRKLDLNVDDTDEAMETDSWNEKQTSPEQKKHSSENEKLESAKNMSSPTKAAPPKVDFVSPTPSTVRADDVYALESARSDESSTHDIELGSFATSTPKASNKPEDTKSLESIQFNMSAIEEDEESEENAEITIVCKE